MTTATAADAASTYTCSACHVFFPTGQDQRIHMKEGWHVFNIKRRIASLPPIPRDAFREHVDEQVDTARTSTSSSDTPTATTEVAPPLICLFCDREFASVAPNVEHMHSIHGLFIPDPDKVIDMETFVGYLATEVRVWHECLYCGATKSSTASIQNHMRDKGHCLLNLDGEPELLEFWEDQAPDQKPTSLSTTEMRFPSGKVVESRHALPAKRRPQTSTSSRSSPPTTLAPVCTNRQLASRGMGILGVSVQQRQVLVLAEKKAQRSEAIASRAREWIRASSANSQKFDQLDNQMKWGKQNHKLLPRPFPIMPPNFNLPLDVSRLRNDRLRLVPLEDNLEEWADAYVQDANRNPRVYDWLTYGPFASGADYVAFYNETSRDNPSELLLAILVEADTVIRGGDTVARGTFAGICGLVGQPDRSTADIGQLLLTRFHRTFVGTHTNALLLHACLDAPAAGGMGLRRVQWQANSRNTASVAAAKRLGFRWEGLIRWQQVLPPGKAGETCDGSTSPGRHTAMLSLCWDDWLRGGREHVDELVK